MGLLHTLKSKLRSSEQAENEEGFTLIELVVVVAIVGILTSIAIPTFGSIQENSRVASGKTTAKNTYAALVSVTQGMDLDLTKAEVLANANVHPDELVVTANAGWTNEANLCVTATWVAVDDSNPTKAQNYGPGCD